MKKPNLRFIRPLASLFAVPFLVSSLHAIPVRILAWDSDIAEMHLAIGDSKGNTVIAAMHPSKRTSSYQVTAGETPPVLVALDKKGPDGKPFTSPIKIPEGIKQPLLVVLPDAKAPTGIRVFVMDDDATGFSWGSTRFINALGKEVVFVHEKKILALPPSWNPVQLEPGGETRNMEVKLFFRDQPQRAVYSAVWEHNTDLRMLVFLLPGEDPRLGPVSMKMIPEDRRIAKMEEQAGKKTDVP